MREREREARNRNNQKREVERERERRGTQIKRDTSERKRWIEKEKRQINRGGGAREERYTDKEGN